MTLQKQYFVYILTNKRKTVLYTGLTNNLPKRLNDHRADSASERKSFAGKYNCIHLIYYEIFTESVNGIRRESEIKGWSRAKKEALIATLNPEWKFLEDDFYIE